MGGIVSPGSIECHHVFFFSSVICSGKTLHLRHQLRSFHFKYRTPYVAIIISGTIVAVMAYALPPDQIAVVAGVIFLLLFTQVNISVINIKGVYGDKLNYGFKIPLYPVIPIVGIFLRLGLALYLLVTQPWIISG